MPIGGFPPYSQNSSSGDRYDFNDLPPEIAIEHQALNRKQQIANMLIQQGLQPAQGQMVGGWYVPASPIQGLAGLAQVAAGKYASSRNDDARRELSGKSNNMLSDAMQKHKDAIADKQTTTEMEGPGVPVRTAQPGEGFSPEELKQPTALYGSMGEALGKLDESRPSAFFKEGPRPTSVTSTPVSAEQTRQSIIENLAMNSHPQAQKMGQFMLSELDRKEARADQVAFRKEDREDTQANQNTQNALTRESRSADAKAAVEAQVLAGLISREDANKYLTQSQKQHDERMLADKQRDRENAVKLKGMDVDGRKEVQGMKTGVNRPMSATAQKELIQTEEELQGSHQAIEHLKSALAINDKAMGFTGSGAVASAGSFLPDAIRPKAVDATVDLDNLITGSALPQLKAIFGGMPTEGERKILLDVSGSSSKTPSQRKAIFERAIQGANNRIKFGSQKAEQLRGGTYFSGDGGLDTSAAPNPVSPIVSGKGPQAGVVEDGYRFKGGDPAKSDSWEKVK